MASVALRRSPICLEIELWIRGLLVVQSYLGMETLFVCSSRAERTVAGSEEIMGSDWVCGGVDLSRGLVVITRIAWCIFGLEWLAIIGSAEIEMF